jgi:2-C-methyl-D-erythritol 4-phosphate cytidylyltransferase
MNHYGKQLHIVHGNYENAKITTPEDFYMFRAIYDARENEQLQPAEL